MKRTIISIIASFTTIAALAQLAVKVEYDYHFYTVRGSETNRPMILTSSTIQSKFYNPDTNRIDSAYNSPEKKAAFDAYINSRIWSKDEIPPTRWEKMYVEKERNNNVMTVYDTVAGEDRYYYIEPIGEIIWEVKDSTETILGYECQMAECDYHGRHWTVWFTPDIPIQDGPWKLNGLPGLILRAQEDFGLYKFTAVGIESFEKEIEPVYQKFLYEKIDRKELLQTKRLIDENFGGFVSARTGINLPKNMKSTEINKTYDYLETDYR